MEWEIEMRILKTIAFIIGMIMIFMTVGTDDFYTLAMHQEHHLHIVFMFLGVLMCIPFSVMMSKEKIGEF